MGNILLLYISGGLITCMALVAYLGWLISKKHSCSLLEGISRFENSDSPGVIIFCVFIIMALWPIYVIGLLAGKWKPYWTKMVDDLNL